MRIRAKIWRKRYLVTETGLVFCMHYKRGAPMRLMPQHLGYERCGGYPHVSIDGRGMAVHRIVAECFVPHPPGCDEVNHKDGVKTNNNASNLEWVTHLENVRHAYRTGLITGAQIVRNARHPHPTRRTISVETARRAKELICDGLPNGIVAEMLGVEPGVVRCIRLGQTYKEVPWPKRERKPCKMNNSEARWALDRFRKSRTNQENTCK